MKKIPVWIRNWVWSCCDNECAGYNRTMEEWNDVSMNGRVCFDCRNNAESLWELIKDNINIDTEYK